MDASCYSKNGQLKIRLINVEIIIMKKNYYSKISLLGMLIISLIFNSCNDVKQVEKVSESEIIESYVYLLGRALAVRQEQTDLAENGIDYNVIKYNEAGKADFVNPNLDVAYMEAWFAMDENSAILLTIPEVKNRYYTVQLMDGWGEVITNINERNYPDHPFGQYALVLENSTANIPQGAIKVVMPIKKIKMLARVELQNTWEKAVELQKQFKVEVIGVPTIEPIINFPTFTNKDLPDVAVFDYCEELLKTQDSKMVKNDSIQSISRKVAAYVSQSESNSLEVKKIIQEKAVPQFMSYAINNAGKLENNWLATIYAGEYKGNYWTRTAANFVGIWANSPQEVVYFIASKDNEDNALGSGKTYVLKFDKDNLPINSVSGFWSIILVDFPNYRVVANELERYNFNNFSPLTFEEDGGLNIYISPTYNPEWPKSNWLPSPKEQAFNLTIRMYVPKENVVNGDWFPTGVEKME